MTVSEGAVTIGPVVTPTAGMPDHDLLAPRATAVRTDGEIELDGRLDEEAWRSAPVITAFWQREPDEAAPASQRTEVRFAYDDATLFIGARMYDSEGADGVVSQLVRRDGDPQSDMLTLRLDTFLDHNGAASFSINPAGVRGDALNFDDSWNPIWRAEASIDADGWSAELAIPFSQLRFPKTADQVWGLQVERVVSRLNETAAWSFWYQKDSWGPSRFGHLEGLRGIQARTDRLEVLPYAVTQLDVRGSVDAADPFTQDAESTARVGADLKYLLTSNLTLSATINPDFGQAEVDPAVVNLSAFETFFPEKREFFVEGQQNFGFGNFWCKFCSNASSLGMLFTRRIGRAPQGSSLADDAGEYSDVPSASTILGAAKITGRTGAGTSVGLLGAVTQRERADVATETGEVFPLNVEPATTYLVGRVKQGLLDGDLQIGGIATGVLRDFDDPELRDMLSRHAEAVGLDAELWWADRTYHLLLSSAISNVSGATAAIERIQRASARYFQRPDRQHGANGLFSDRYDVDRTSLRGWGLYSRVAKDAGDWQWELAGNARSPGFENNDLAFLTRSDYVWMNGNVARSWTTPGSWYRSIWTTVGAQQEYNFDGDLTDRQFHASFYMEAPFYWDFNAFVIHRPSAFDDRLTRGGPVVRQPSSTFVFAGISTDDRRPVVANLNPSYGWNEEGGWNYDVTLDLTLKPRSNVVLSLAPSLGRSYNTAQYLNSVEDATAGAFFGSRYVFSELEQTSLSMTTRLNWTFTPTMSLELFLQPLISANEFGELKEFDAPRQLGKSVYGRDVGVVRSEGEGLNGVYWVDPDGAGPADEFSVDNEDFNFRSLRGNAVYRWEFAPGSTLFVVWTQDRNVTAHVGDLDFSRDASALFGAASDHVLLVKLSYWLGP